MVAFGHLHTEARDLRGLYVLDWVVEYWTVLSIGRVHSSLPLLVFYWLELVPSIGVDWATAEYIVQ